MDASPIAIRVQFRDAPHAFRSQEAPLRTLTSGNTIRRMSVQEIKDSLAALPRGELDEVTAFLFQLRRRGPSEYQANVSRRLSDTDPSHWLSPDEFERALDVGKDR